MNFLQNTKYRISFEAATEGEEGEGKEMGKSLSSKAEWRISLPQIVASMLTEPVLVDFFDRKHQLAPALTTYRNGRFIRQHSATTDQQQRLNV